MMSDHYTAVIEVTHTTEPRKTTGASSRPYEKDIEEPRKKRDITRIVVRAKSLDDLKLRINGHVDLMEDDDEPRPTQGAKTNGN